jgi:hypothetical protein
LIGCTAARVPGALRRAPRGHGNVTMLSAIANDLKRGAAEAVVRATFKLGE